MTTTSFQDAGVDERDLMRTARITGLVYVGMCITGLFGHFIIPGQIFDAGDAAATLNYLAERETLARFGIAMDEEARRPAVIVATIHTSPLLRDKCLDAGAGYYYSKADDWEELLEVVTSLAAE